MRAGRWTRSVLAGALGIASVVVTGGAADASDETTAEKLVITKADVAKAHVSRGVTVGAPGGSEATPTDTFGPIAECVGKPVPGRAVVAVVHGPQLVDKAGGSSIGSNADIVQTKAMAQADRAVVQSAALPHCLAQVAEQQGAVANGSVDARRIKLKRYGDYSTAVLLQAFGADGGPATFTGIAVLTLRGRAELSDNFLTDGATPYSRKAVEKILDKLAKRIDAAKV